MQGYLHSPCDNLPCAPMGPWVAWRSPLVTLGPAPPTYLRANLPEGPKGRGAQAGGGALPWSTTPSGCRGFGPAFRLEVSIGQTAELIALLSVRCNRPNGQTAGPPNRAMKSRRHSITSSLRARTWSSNPKLGDNPLCDILRREPAGLDAEGVGMTGSSVGTSAAVRECTTSALRPYGRLRRFGTIKPTTAAARFIRDQRFGGFFICWSCGCCAAVFVCDSDFAGLCIGSCGSGNRF
jgi:hypothetical protein